MQRNSSTHSLKPYSLTEKYHKISFVKLRPHQGQPKQILRVSHRSKHWQILTHHLQTECGLITAHLPSAVRTKSLDLSNKGRQRWAKKQGLMHLNSLSIWARTTDQWPSYWVRTRIMFLLEKHATFVMEKHQSPWGTDLTVFSGEWKCVGAQIQNGIDQPLDCDDSISTE